MLGAGVDSGGVKAGDGIETFEIAELKGSQPRSLVRRALTAPIGGTEWLDTRMTQGFHFLK